MGEKSSEQTLGHGSHKDDFPNRHGRDFNLLIMEVGMARFDMTDFEWSVIEPAVANKPRGVPRLTTGAF